MTDIFAQEVARAAQTPPGQRPLHVCPTTGVTPRDASDGLAACWASEPFEQAFGA